MQKKYSPIKPSLIKLSPEEKCDHCHSSKCCHYVTESLITPSGIDDFDKLLWQVSHENTHVFKDCDGWYLRFMSKCEHLQQDGRCGIYERRPKVCREHTNDFCEYDVSVEEVSDLYFTDFKSLDAYCRKRFKTWDRRFKD